MPWLLSFRAFSPAMVDWQGMHSCMQPTSSTMLPFPGRETQVVLLMVLLSMVTWFGEGEHGALVCGQAFVTSLLVLLLSSFLSNSSSPSADDGPAFDLHDLPAFNEDKADQPFPH